MFIDAVSYGSIICATNDVFWSPEEMAKQVAARYSGLRDLNINTGDKIGLFHGGTPEFFADLFAVWRAGACAVCVNPEITVAEGHKIKKLVNPKIILGDKKTKTRLGSLNPISFEGVSALNKSALDLNPLNNCLDDDALILFTSGTTGTPKGVVHTFRSLQARLALNQAHINPKDIEVSLCPLPTHFGHGLIGNCLTPLASGGAVVLASGTSIDISTSLGQIIDNYNITFLSSVPAMWHMVLRFSPAPTKKSLRRIHIGSAPLAADIWQKVCAWSGIQEVFNMYGITETANWFSGTSAADGGVADGLIGHSWGGCVKILSNNKNLLDVGRGELVLQSPSLFARYFCQSELTEKAFFQGWYRTGDIAEIDESGQIKLIGRLKFEINRGGIKINPEDIEIMLMAHPAIDDVCAFAVPDKMAGEIIGVAYSQKTPDKIDEKELISWCSTRITREKRPEIWFKVNEIPKTDRGKTDRDKLLRRLDLMENY